METVISQIILVEVQEVDQSWCSARLGPVLRTRPAFQRIQNSSLIFEWVREQPMKLDLEY